MTDLDINTIDGRMAERISDATGMPQILSHEVYRVICSQLIETLSDPSTLSLSIEGFGDFEFIQMENFGTINVVEGSSKAGEYLAVYVNRMKFRPSNRLKNLINDTGCRIKFSPSKVFDTGEHRGRIQRPK